MDLTIVHRARCLATAIGLSLTAGAAAADMPVTYKEGSRALFQLNAPDYWSVRSGGPRQISPPGENDPRMVNRIIGFQPTAGGHSWVGFISPPNVETLTQAQAYLRDIGKFLVKGAKVQSARDLRLNGLQAQSFAGQGRRDGRSVNFTAVAIDLPNGRVAIAVVILEPGVDAAVLEATNQLISSVRAVR
ncbi:hypothetical protein I5535_06485 [Rhodobacteraceae bacterium F11138]|nr:hypothetical protein [Rhodobacteraceae bacterium F11138]